MPNMPRAHHQSTGRNQPQTGGGCWVEYVIPKQKKKLFYNTHLSYF